MTNSSEYLGLLVTFILCGTIAGAMFLLTTLLGPKNKMTPAKSEPFECGVDQIHSPIGRYSVKFYLVAMFFILFDIEIIWFFPWAVILRELGWFGLMEMSFFAGVLVLGLAYAWKKGALQWEK